jgi:hypothetical protein
MEFCGEQMNGVPRDTTEEAWGVQIRGLRRLGVAGRAAMALELSDNVRQIVRDGVRYRHPDWDETRVRQEVFRIVYGERLYNEVIGKDASSDG